jgi:hypothetical protein
VFLKGSGSAVVDFCKVPQSEPDRENFYSPEEGKHPKAELAEETYWYGAELWVETVGLV